MKSDIIIRAYTANDKNAMLGILQANTPQYFSPEEEMDLINYFENEIEYYFVAEIASKVIGGGGVNFNEDKTIAKISWDILHPNYQDKGIGTQLINYRINMLKNFQNIKKITVRTSQFANKFYEKRGFKLISITKDFWAKGYDLFYMEVQAVN